MRFQTNRVREITEVQTQAGGGEGAAAEFLSADTNTNKAQSEELYQRPPRRPPAALRLKTKAPISPESVCTSGMTKMELNGNKS